MPHDELIAPAAMDVLLHSDPVRPDRIPCPRCNRVVHRVTVLEGATLLLCDNRCGQHMLVVSNGAHAVVTPITADVVQHMRQHLARVEQLQQALDAFYRYPPAYGVAAGGG